MQGVRSAHIGRGGTELMLLKCSLVLLIPDVTRDHFQGEWMAHSLHTARATLPWQLLKSLCF